MSENGARKSESPAPVQAPPLELNLLPAELVLRSSVLPALDGVYRLKRHGGGGGERRGAGEEEPASASGGGDGPIHAVGYEYVQAGTDAPASPSPKQKQKKQKQKKKKKKRKELAPEAGSTVIGAHLQRRVCECQLSSLQVLPICTRKS